MDNEKSVEEQLMQNFKKVKQQALNYLLEKNFIKEEEEVNIKNVIRYKKDVELTKKDLGGKDKSAFKLYVVEWENTNSGIKDENALVELKFLVEEDEKGNIINIYSIEELMKEYEKDSFKNIKDVVDKTKENEEKPEEEQDEELKKQSLEELEDKEKEEEEKEQEGKEEKGKESDERKKRKPSYVIERVNPDKAKMDYWHTVKQACGLPSKVDTLAFAYPVSSEDKVDYANITVYMLDKDGYIIDDLVVDDYFEFDSSTGNNPMQDKTVRHEEEDNKGEVQLEENRTMIRLYAKNSNDKNTYISLEQKNSFGDYNDINAGRKTVAGTQNVEKQLETDHVRVWEAEEEMLVKANAGLYNMNDIFNEAEQHKEHGDEEHVQTENADGIETTQVICESPYVPDTNITWEQFSKSVGDRDIKDLQKEFFEQYDGNNGQGLILKIQSDYKEQKEYDEPVEEQEIEENGIYMEGPWDSVKH